MLPDEFGRKQKNRTMTSMTGHVDDDKSEGEVNRTKRAISRFTLILAL